MSLIDKDTLLRELKRRSYEAAEARMTLIAEDFIDLVNDADVVEVPRWIPTTETMPPDNKRVLAIAEEYWGNFVIGRYYRGEGWEFENWDDDINFTVTHWLSIPDEPEAIENGNDGR